MPGEAQAHDDEDDAADHRAAPAGSRRGTPPANVAVMPSSVNTRPKPATYATAWRTAAQREGCAPVPWAATATAVSWPR